MKKSCPGYKSHTPTRATLGELTFHTFTLNMANRIHEKQNVGSARWVTRFAGSSSCDGSQMENVNKQRQHFISLSKLRHGPLELDVRRVRFLLKK